MQTPRRQQPFSGGRPPFSPKKEEPEAPIGLNWRILSNHATVMSNVAKRAKEYDPILAATIQCEQHFPKELLLKCLPLDKERDKKKKRRCASVMRERMLCVTQQLHPLELAEARDARDTKRMDELIARTWQETRKGNTRAAWTNEEREVVKECSVIVDNKKDHLFLIKSQESMECYVPRLFPAQYGKLSDCMATRKDVDYCTAEATETVDQWARFVSKAGSELH